MRSRSRISLTICIVMLVTVIGWAARSEAIVIRDDLAVARYEALSLAPRVAATGWLRGLNRIPGGGRLAPAQELS